MEENIEKLEPHQVIDLVQRLRPRDLLQSQDAGIESPDLIVLACGHGDSNVVQPSGLDVHRKNLNRKT